MSEIHTLAGAYALDAIDDLERVRFDHHLAECPACATEVAELTETVVTLTDATAEVPPVALRSAIRARVATTPQLRHETGIASRHRPLQWQRWLAAAAAVVALGGAGTAGYVISDHSGRGASTAAVVEARRIAAVLAAPDARMQSTAAGGGRVSVVASVSLNEAVAVLTDLPSPGTDHAYQLWVIHARVPRSVGVLATGRTDATELFSGVRGAQAFGVSREPAGGSATPSLPLVAQLPLA
jgi:anti-sigma-K factor RskA